MSTPNPIIADPKTASWVDPPTNVDGSPVAPGEITGYMVGVRVTDPTGTPPGTYPYTATAPATATTELLSLLNPILPTGKPLTGAVRAVTGATDASGNAIMSAWSPEGPIFSLTPPPPVPSNPTAFTVA